MAYVPVPKDLNKIKTKLALNLTKRQLICFSLAAAAGIPSYLFSRGTIGNSPALFLTESGRFPPPPSRPFPTGKCTGTACAGWPTIITRKP